MMNSNDDNNIHLKNQMSGLLVWEYVYEEIK